MSDVCEDQYASFWEGGETSWSDDWYSESARTLGAYRERLDGHLAYELK